MTEIQERAVRASEVRVGDRLALSGRLVTQAVHNGRTVLLWHGQRDHTIADVDAPIRVQRRVRVEVPEQAEPPGDTGHVWFVAQRGSQGRSGTGRPQGRR
jgi:hypothetical protein